MAWESIVNWETPDYAAIMLGIAFLTQIWYMGLMARNDLPAKYNIFKKRRLKTLVPNMRSQFEWGRHFTSGWYSPDPTGEKERELADLRSELYALGCKFPSPMPGDADWGLWIGFLETLLPLAEKGELEKARMLRPRQS